MQQRVRAVRPVRAVRAVRAVRGGALRANFADRVGAPKVTLVEGYPFIKSNADFYALCDVPNISDFTNRLSYSLVETPDGVLLFQDKQHLTVLRNHTQLPHHVVRVKSEQLKVYRQRADGTKTGAIVVYNSYSDMHTKTSYFLYYRLT
jgi:hypothetical protein